MGKNLPNARLSFSCKSLDTLTRRILLLRKDFHHCIYFIIVSLTTVGYGKIIPLSISGKLIIVFLVIVILVVVPD